MDPVTLTTTVIAIAGAVCKSYEQIAKLVTRIQKASKELERIRSRAENINSLVINLKRALEESAIRKVIERDKLALSHVEALDGPLKAVECTLDEVVEKITEHYRPSKGGKHYKVRWKYYLSTSDWEDLQERLDFSIQILGASMQGLNTCVCPSPAFERYTVLILLQAFTYYASSVLPAKIPPAHSAPMPNLSLKPQKIQRTH